MYWRCSQSNKRKYKITCHALMQYGADLRLIDLQGKTSLHHAVTGGNMWVEGTTHLLSLYCQTNTVFYMQWLYVAFPSVAVHYIWETGMFRFSYTDMYQATPLHLAASTGNTEMVQYLLRDQVHYSLTCFTYSLKLKIYCKYDCLILVTFAWQPGSQEQKKI